MGKTLDKSKNGAMSRSYLPILRKAPLKNPKGLNIIFGDNYQKMPKLDLCESTVYSKNKGSSDLEP